MTESAPPLEGTGPQIDVQLGAASEKGGTTEPGQCQQEWGARDAADDGHAKSRAGRGELTADSFDQLLTWLDRDREQAGRNYEIIRHELVKKFRAWGCFFSAEDLADRTIDRVARKVPAISSSYVGERLPYFYRVARYVYLESIRPKPEPPPADLTLDEPGIDREQYHQCLDRCMEGLSPKSRNLVLEFFQDEKQAKIQHRKNLAAQLGITSNALRIRVFRVVTVLRGCVGDCLKNDAK